MKYALVIISLLALWSPASKNKCYCLNVEESRSVMLDNCMILKPNHEFIYLWESDIVGVEERGKWRQENDVYFLTTYEQPEDFIKVLRKKAKEKQDSVTIHIIDEIKEKWGWNLSRYTQDTVIQIPFNTEGIAKIAVDTLSEYGIDFLRIPWQSRFKIESNDETVELRYRFSDSIHRIFFKDERFQVKGEKLFWLDQVQIHENHWVEVDQEKIHRKFRQSFE